MAITRAGFGPLMTSSRSLVCPQCRASDEANLRLTPPCFHELQVFGVVGRNDAPADVAAGHAPGEWEVRDDAWDETRFHLRTGSTSVVPWLVVSERGSDIAGETARRRGRIWVKADVVPTTLLSGCLLAAS